MLELIIYLGKRDFPRDLLLSYGAMKTINFQLPDKKKIFQAGGIHGYNFEICIMGLKRISPNLWVRIKSGWRTGLTFLLGVATIGGLILAGVSGAGVHIPAKLIIGLGIVLVLLTLLVAYVTGRMKLLPDLFVDETGSDGPYVCEFCSPNELREACELTKPFYGHEYVDFSLAESWRQKNPKGFVQITNSQHNLCACFGVLALSDSFMEHFILGELADTQLLSADICDFEDSIKCTKLYISGVVVRDPSTYIGSKRARVMLWSMLVYLEKLYGLNESRELFAIGVTEEAEKLMKHLGFQIIQEKRHRVDKCNLYSFNLSKDSWNRLISLVGDLSPMTTINF